MNDASTASLQVAFVGDVALGGEFVQAKRPRNAPLIYPFAPLRDQLADADVVVVNLEGPIGTSESPRTGRAALLHNDPEVLDWLSSFPCCICTLANNHTMDYGVEALVRTQKLLAERGIHFVGAGLNKEDADRELRLKVKGLAIGILAFTTDEIHVGSVIAGPSSPGCSGLPDEETGCKRVSRLADEADAVITLLHWGHEFFNYPTPAQVSLCRKLALAGATMVIGHHPHVQQGCETVGDSLICHSLGNLLLPEMRTVGGRIQYRKPITKQFAILHADVSRKKVAHWRLEGGCCDKSYNLLPYTHSALTRFKEERRALSAPLLSADYPEFWNKYQKRRSDELEREGLRDALAKLGQTDWRSLIRGLKISDLKRNARRILNLLAPSR